MASHGRGAAAGGAIAAVCLINLPVFRALHWGHPEELLCGALVAGSALAACAAGRCGRRCCSAWRSPRSSGRCWPCRRCCWPPRRSAAGSRSSPSAWPRDLRAVRDQLAGALRRCAARRGQSPGPRPGRRTDRLRGRRRDAHHGRQRLVAVCREARRGAERRRGHVRRRAALGGLAVARADHPRGRAAGLALPAPRAAAPRRRARPAGAAAPAALRARPEQPRLLPRAAAAGARASGRESGARTGPRGRRSPRRSGRASRSCPTRTRSATCTTSPGSPSPPTWRGRCRLRSTCTGPRSVRRRPRPAAPTSPAWPRSRARPRASRACAAARRPASPRRTRPSG